MTKGFITSTRDVGKPFYDRLFSKNDYVTKITSAHGLFYPSIEIDTKRKGKPIVAEMPSFTIGCLRISFEI